MGRDVCRELVHDRCMYGVHFPNWIGNGILHQRISQFMALVEIQISGRLKSLDALHSKWMERLRKRSISKIRKSSMVQNSISNPIGEMNTIHASIVYEFTANIPKTSNISSRLGCK